MTDETRGFFSAPALAWVPAAKSPGQISATENGRLSPFESVRSTLPGPGCYRRNPSAPGPWAPAGRRNPAFPPSCRRPGPAGPSGRQDKGAGGGRDACPAARPTGPYPHGHDDPTETRARGARRRPRRLAEEGAAAATMSAAPPRSQAPGGQSAAAAARTPRPTPPTPAKQAGPGAPETRRLNAINRKSRG